MAKAKQTESAAKRTTKAMTPEALVRRVMGVGSPDAMSMVKRMGPEAAKSLVQQWDSGHRQGMADRVTEALSRAGEKKDDTPPAA